MSLIWSPRKGNADDPRNDPLGYPERRPVNRFFRSAFFPLIVIVLLVWLASQTLIPKAYERHEA